MDGHKRIHYHLSGREGFDFDLTVVIEGGTLACLEPAPVARPWTALACRQCPNCPLDAAVTPLCPFAARIEPVVRSLGTLLSHDQVGIEAECNGRRVSGVAPAQGAASSMIGLIAAVSGCPHTAFLGSMAWFHLPLATEEETLFRAAASYLLKQYFVRESGLEPDWQLAGLKRRYEELQKVNMAMAARLRQVAERDATVNAIVRLDMFAKAVDWSIDEMLDELRPIFTATG